MNRFRAALGSHRPFLRLVGARRLPRPPGEADRSVGGRRRYRQHLPRRSSRICRSISAGTVVIANVGGASGTKGAKEAKDSPADGYTIFAVHDSIHSTFYTGVADVNSTDFQPICLVTSTPSISPRVRRRRGRT